MRRFTQLKKEADAMQQRTDLLQILGACMLALVLVTGCSKKGLDTSATGKSFVPPGQAGTTDLAAKTGMSTGPASSHGLESGSSGVGAGLSGDGPRGTGGEASGADAGKAGRESGSSLGDGGMAGTFPALGGAGKGGGGDIVVAKAEPAETAERQLEQMKKEQLATAQASLDDAFFAFDSWKLTEEGRRALQHDAEWLKANPEQRITIEGYCDERGTVDYNLVLGEKRANAARNYLVELGVDADRVTTISYGKERPFCTEHDESCYQQNRRAHVVVRAQ
jgi:peptidoglycan-associated lipoprotein